MNDTYEDRLEFWRQQYSRFMPIELTCAPISYNQGPRRFWKKSQKKIRRERRQRMAYKKGGAK